MCCTVSFVTKDLCAYLSARSRLYRTSYLLGPSPCTYIFVGPLSKYDFFLPEVLSHHSKQRGEGHVSLLSFYLSISSQHEGIVPLHIPHFSITMSHSCCKTSTSSIKRPAHPNFRPYISVRIYDRGGVPTFLKYHFHTIWPSSNTTPFLLVIWVNRLMFKHFLSLLFRITK